jgi:hypothetical protein
VTALASFSSGVGLPTVVEHWSVGSSQVGIMPLTVEEISAALVSDWLPSLQAAVGSSLMTWPSHLLEAMPDNGNLSLTLHEAVRRSERQWKAFISWMLGVAGARSFLKDDGYGWVAPASAFYKNAVQEVDLGSWHPQFPRSILTVEKPSPPVSKNCPDYLALRPVPSTAEPAGYDWAVVEAKGTDDSLLQPCRATWSNQARNIVIFLNGTALQIPRFLVVATRVNPKGKQKRTRRLKIRAWNQHLELASPPAAFGVEVAAAHLFGLFMGLQMPDNARAIGVCVQARREHLLRSDRRISAGVLKDVATRAEAELDDRLGRSIGDAVEAETALRTELGRVDVAIARPLLDFARVLQRAHSVAEAAGAMREADVSLRVWRELQTPQTKGRAVTLPAGLKLSFPESFGPRKVSE